MEKLEILLSEEDPVVVSVAEHWCREDEVSFMVTPGYRLITSFCRSTREHGGTSIYVKCNCEAYSLDLQNLCIEMHFECSAVRLVFGGRKISVLSIYRPPKGDFNLFLKQLCFTLDLCNNHSTDIFLCGDLNINYLDNNVFKQSFDDIILSYNLQVTSLTPTRVVTNCLGQTSVSKVDYILTNVDNSQWDSNIYEAHFSDHRICSLKYHIQHNQFETTNYKPIKQQYRDVSDHNITNLVSILSKIQFDQVYVDDVDLGFDNFIDILKYALDYTCPVKNYYIHDKGKTQAKWITSEIKHSSLRLKNLYWLCKQDGGSSSRISYNEAKTKHNALLKRSKLAYHNKLIDNSHNKNKTVWNLVNKETGRKKIKNNISLNLEGSRCSDPKQLADAFVEYFANITEKKLFDHFGNSRPVSCTVSEIVNNTFFFYPVGPNEVINIINDLKNKHNGGIDCLSVKLLKTLSTHLAQHIAHLINLSVVNCRFPNTLKKATVLPVFKKNNREDIVNYRPISLLSVFSKVFERIIFDRMFNFIDRFKIMASCQHGFRRGKSTQSAACSFTANIYKLLDSGKHVAGLFFDLSRAFDSLSFSFIKCKLYNIGFRGVFLDWIVGYLSDRTMFVKVENAASDCRNIGIGVPQGSVLGPLIFLLFVNDLPNSIDSANLTMFADDTSVVVSARTSEELSEVCQNLIVSFLNWCNSNALILNVDKTILIYFRSWNDPEAKLSVTINNSVLHSSDSTKFLGVYLDCQLNWSKHIDMLNKTINRSLYAISRIRSSLPLHALLNIYYSLVYSHLSYNVVLWGNAVNSRKILVTQKRILRNMFGINPRESCKGLFVDNKILTLPCIYIYKTLSYVKENILSLEKNSQYHNYSTRYCDLLCIPKHKSNKYEKSTNYSGLKLYNKLSTKFRSLDTVANDRER